ncbi:MAG TPA: cysteine dioxygenase family protein [Candidatus Nitrosotalea sp.]|nr:cysteine dioxygenase family protein [Candidatus Nitrosotalea sp.]
MFRRLIDELRFRGPLERGSSEVGGLLLQSVAEWQGGEALVARAGGYTRTCAYRGAQFEVLLLNWAPGAVSAIHDHGGQHCWMIVLDGRLEVEDYTRLDPGEVPGYAHVEARGCSRLEPGEMDLRSGRFDLHRVAATNDAPAISLHVYAGPLRSYLIYEELARRCETARGSYDAVLSPYSEPARR